MGSILSALNTRLPQDKFSRAVLFWKILISVLFLTWAGLFIAHSSHIGVDGKRYYALFDDAYISMRYGWNLSHGHGLVWNVGERIEGYTNLLMTLFMSLVTMIFNKRLSALVIQISGGLFIIGTAYYASKIMNLLGDDLPEKSRARLTTAAYAFSLAYYPLLFWSLMGMETSLLSFLISLAYYHVLTFHKQKSPRNLWIGSALISMASITRPDAFILAVPIFLYLLVVEVRAKNWVGIRQIVIASLIVVLLPLLQLLFRWQYYGVLVPNTYTLKVAGLPLDIRLKNGLIFIKPFIQSILLMAGFSVVGSLERENRLEKVLFAVFLIQLAYQIWVGGEPWFYWRLLSPAIPFAIVLSLKGGNRFYIWSNEKFSKIPYRNQVGVIIGLLLLIVPIISDRLGGYPGFGFLERTSFQIGLIIILLTVFVHSSKTRSNATKVSFNFAIVVTGLIVFFANYAFLPEMFFRKPAYTTPEHADTVDFSIIISEVALEDASIGVTWAGAIPYYTGLYSVDFLGKIDPYIANLPPEFGENALHWGGMLTVPGHNKYDLMYSIGELRPTFLQVVQWGNQDLSEWVLIYYERLSYRGYFVYALRGSEQVNWSRLLSDQ